MRESEWIEHSPAKVANEVTCSGRDFGIDLNKCPDVSHARPRRIETRPSSPGAIPLNPAPVGQASSSAQRTCGLASRGRCDPALRSRSAADLIARGHCLWRQHVAAHAPRGETHDPTAIADLLSVRLDERFDPLSRHKGTPA